MSDNWYRDWYHPWYHLPRASGGTGPLKGVPWYHHSAGTRAGTTPPSELLDSRHRSTG